MATTKIPAEFLADNTIVALSIAENIISTRELAANGITSAQIASNAILTRHIDDNQITGDQIADNSVGTPQLAGIARGKIIVGDASGNPALLSLGSNGYVLKSDGSDITWAEDATVAALTTEQVQDIAGAMFSSNTETGIAATYQDGDGTIDLVIGANVIVSGMIAQNSILTRHIDDNQVTTDQIAANTIATANIADNAIDGTKIASNSILTRHIDDDQVTGAQLADALTVVTSVTTPLVDAAIVDGENFKVNGGQGSDGQVLTSTGSGVAWEAAAGTTINNNANNRLITGSGTANTLEGESGLIFDGTNLLLGATSYNAGAFGSATGMNIKKPRPQLLLEDTDNNKDAYFGLTTAGVFLATQDALDIQFHTSDAERMRITSAGKVHIGNTFSADGSYDNLVVGTGAGNEGLTIYGAANGASSIAFADPNDNDVGNIMYDHSSNYLATIVNATERTRITNGGAFKTKQGTSAYANSTSNYNEICSNADATANLLVRQGSTYYADCINLWYYASTGPNNVHSNFIHAFDQQATRAKLLSNGGFANYQSNDSNLCDEREKKNIVASESTWNDVKSWNIKKFHYNEDENSDAKRYGVIAQDIEKTNPELITDWEKNKASAQELWQEEDKPLPDGVSVGDEKTPAQAQVMRKAVKEQQMYIMTIKALQEALTEIDSLKARITALEE